MKIGIIGCGLIGRKRVLALDKDDQLIACCDINQEVGESFAKEFNCTYYSNYSELLEKSDCEIIIVSVINKFAKEIVSNSLKKLKHVLIEKPMGINYKESQYMLNDSIFYNRILKVGFNHRFHPAILKAKEYSKSIGKLMFIRAYYGHGGRIGMEKEWRSSKELCGGGELLDQGVHLIDLSLWFINDEIKTIFGKKSTKFWNMEVEDNAFILLTSKNNIDIQLHVSWTNWKNVFNFEIYGKKGYLKITGLGGSYGVEKLEYGKRKKEGGVPDITNFTFYEKDNSWEYEWKEFKLAIKENRQPIGNAQDGLNANRIIHYIYESSSKNKIINL